MVNMANPAHKDKIAAYRFLNNEKVKPLELIKTLQNQCRENCAGPDLVVLQNTTEYNYQHLSRHHKADSLGAVGGHAMRWGHAMAWHEK